MREAKPSDFVGIDAWSSKSGSATTEAMANDIMNLLHETGNEWREITWEEYTKRCNPTKYDGRDEYRFNQIKEYFGSAGAARRFCEVWRRVLNHDILTQTVFDGMPCAVVAACVDWDGTLRFSIDHRVWFVPSVGKWSCVEWISTVVGTNYEPCSMIFRLPKVCG